MEKYVVSRELAEKLKTAGYTQNTQCCYYDGEFYVNNNGHDYSGNVVCTAAPISDELLEQLPKFIDLPDDKTGILELTPLSEGLRCEYLGPMEGAHQTCYGAMYDKINANSLAQLWLWAKENGHLREAVKDIKRQCWIYAAAQIDADPEDHADDEEIQPVYDRLIAELFECTPVMPTKETDSE